MSSLSVDASNSCIPPSCHIISLAPPNPTTTRGVPLSLHGEGGRINAEKPLLVYPSGRFVVVRELENIKEEKKVNAFVYRGHTATVTTAKFSPSGCYIASGDIKGKLRVWSYDNEEHLCKLDIQALAGPIHDIAWDADSQRIVVVGEGSKTDATSVCTKVIQWDTGVTCGQLGQHTMKKASSCSFKPNRPMRIVTSGSDDSKCLFNAGPPFKRVTDGKPAESCHTRGSIHCVRYNNQGTMIASVGTDKMICFYDGKTMELVHKMELLHSASIYSCAWNKEGDYLLTCSADGTVKLISTNDFTVLKSWDLAQQYKHQNDTKVPQGLMQMGCAFVKGNIPVTVSLNGQINMLSMTDQSIEHSKSYSGHQSPISSMAVNYAQGAIYTADSDGVICKWDIHSGDSICNIQRSEDSDEGFDRTLMNKVHNGAITGLSFCNNMLLSIGWDDKIRFTDSTYNKTMKSIQLESQPNQIKKGTNVTVVMTVDGLVLVRDDAIVSDLIKVSYEPTAICVSSDDKTVYVGGKDNSVHIYNVDGNTLSEEIRTLSGTHLQPIYALSLSNNGDLLASADVRDICIWDVNEDYSSVIGKGRWCFHNQKINCLTWSNDDSVLASAGSDDSIFFWSLTKKMKRIQYSFAHRGGITGLEFLKNTDGMILASTGNDGCVNLWDVTDDIVKKFG